MLGFHTVDAFKKTVKWEKSKNLTKKVGIENLAFGSIKTDIVAEGNKCTVNSNEEYTLIINGVEYNIKVGINEFEIK